jgi:hypothetical protein
MLLPPDREREVVKLPAPQLSMVRDAIKQYSAAHHHPPARVYVGIAMSVLIGRIIHGVRIMYASGLQENEIILTL